MVSKIISKNMVIGLSALLALVTLGSSTFIASRPDLIAHPGVSLGVTIDLLLFLPLAWLLITRRTGIPKFTIIPVSLLTLLTATIIIPEGYQQHLNFIKTYLLPVLELAFIGFIFLKSFKTLSHISKQLSPEKDALEEIRRSCLTLIDSERLASVVATEIAMFYYVLGSWKAMIPGKTQFSTYRESGILSIFAGVLLILAVETIWLHAYLQKIDLTLAWIITGLSIYSGLQVFAHIKALRSRGHILNPDQLTLRYGLFSEVHIAYNNIDELVFTSENPTSRSEKKLALLGEMEPHNLMIKLKQPVTIYKIYGLRSQAASIYFQCDQKEGFRTEIEYHMGDGKTTEE